MGTKPTVKSVKLRVTRHRKGLHKGRFVIMAGRKPLKLKSVKRVAVFGRREDAEMVMYWLGQSNG